MSNANFLHRHQWQPRTDLPAEMPLREHLRHQFEDAGTVAPTSDDHAQMIAEAAGDDLHQDLIDTLVAIAMTGGTEDVPPME